MTRQQAAHLAVTLMAEHGLSDWEFALDHARNRLGQCDFRRKRITLSKHLIGANGQDVVRDTLLHEIAHALVGPGHGHDKVWKQQAERIGAQPRASTSEVCLPEPKWELVCLRCERVLARRHQRRLRLDRLACRACGPGSGQLGWRAPQRSK